MLKERLVALIAGIALIIAVAGASAEVVTHLAGWDTPAPQAIACNASGSHGGGGC